MTDLHEPSSPPPGEPGRSPARRPGPEPRGDPPTAAALPIALVCAGCGYQVPDDVAFIAGCPRAVDGDDIDHVLRRSLDPAALAFPAATAGPDDSEPTFVRYRTMSRAYHVARAAGWSDARFIELAGRLDDAVAAVDGRGFRETPFEPSSALGQRLGLSGGAVWIKDETGNVAGSHKARHLMGIMLELLVAEERAGGSVSAGAPAARLAIASCGNAALAAAVVARAAGRALDVFVPTWADEVIVARLRELGAQVVPCQRQDGQPGDPTYHRLRAAIAAGAIPFTCQGPENGLAIAGGETLGYEMIARLRREVALEEGADRRDRQPLDAVVVQVGGGALASSVAAAFAEGRALGAIDREPRLYAVQAEGCAPLARAWRLFGEWAERHGVAGALTDARRHRSTYMRPWDTEPASVAHGILDDETYDWFAIVEAMVRTGGGVAVADESTIRESNELGRAATGIDADHTGTAGLAGLMTLLWNGDVRPDETVAVLFTGVRRDDRDIAAAQASAAPTRPMESNAR